MNFEADLKKWLFSFDYKRKFIRYGSNAVALNPGKHTIATLPHSVTYDVLESYRAEHLLKHLTVVKADMGVLKKSLVKDVG